MVEDVLVDEPIISFTWIVPFTKAVSESPKSAWHPIDRIVGKERDKEMRGGRLLFIVLLLLAGSCVYGPRVTVEDSEWGTRIGKYTYLEALAELGEPQMIGESSEGKIAEWVLRQGVPFSIGFGFGGAGYGHHTSTGVGVGTSVSPPPSGEYLRLRFDRDGTLAEWTKVRY